ncbi:MAG: serpin family protein [Vulcanimicrobiaceae bacterium]
MASLLALGPLGLDAQQVIARGAPAREVELLDLAVPVAVVSPLGLDAALCALRPALSAGAARQISAAREDVCADDERDVHASLWVPKATPLSESLATALRTRAELHQGMPPFNAPIAAWLHDHDVPPIQVPAPIALAAVSAVHYEHGWQIDITAATARPPFVGRTRTTSPHYLGTSQAQTDNTAGCERTLLRTEGGGFVILTDARRDVRASAACVERPVTTIDPGPVSVLVPTLDLHSGSGLTAPLEHLGVADLFNGGANPMPKLAPHAAFGLVLQSVALRLDEHGISVKASTVFAIKMSIPQRPRREIVFDHPFVMRVVDGHGGTVALASIGDVGD